MPIEGKMPPGFEGFHQYLVARKQRIDKYLKDIEQLPFKQKIIPRHELRNIQTINEWLRSLLKKVEVAKESRLKSPQMFPDLLKGGQYEMEQLQKMFDTLDSIDDIWRYKFSTESQGDGENLTQTPEDSIYYMTRSGASLRFKMANRKEGLSKVIQPFAEFIFFTDSRKKAVSDVPLLGSSTQEYFTKEFTNLISDKRTIDQDFQSSIKQYYQNGNFFDALKNDKVSFHHNGSPVNKIFFER